MKRLLTRWSPLWLALGLMACDGGDGGDPDGGSPPRDGRTPPPDSSPPPGGEASLAFSPTWGGADAQFQGLNWQAMLDLNIFQPALEALRDTRVVILLCEPSDATCERPVLVREVAEGETDGDPIQDNFGPEIAVTGLPAGDYALMIFADTGVSRYHGLGWDDGFETSETAWGGVVSELDVMLSEEPVRPGFTPPPATMAITLTDGETTDLGELTLQHVHERDISPAPNAERGVLAVAVGEGVRVVDLSTHTVEEIEPGSGFYTHQMVDARGTPFAGTVCGMVDGPDDTVFLLYRDRGVGAGFAVQFDVASRSQLHGGARVLFEDGGMPCRGRFANGRLFVTNASGARGNVSEASGGENLWVASVAGLASGDVTARLHDRSHDPILQHGVDDIAIDGDDVYLTINGDSTLGGLPRECTRSYCVFRASMNRAGQLQLAPLGGSYEYWVGPEIGESYPTARGEVTCAEEASPWAAIEVASFHDGRTLLFLGACLEVAVFDTADGRELDFSAAPGVQGLDGTLFGHAFNAFALSPDGSTLWALPQKKSPVHFNFENPLDGSRTTFNRYMALPIQLSSGDAPALHPDFEGEDIDGWEGTTGIGPNATPAVDPGLDINLAYYTEYRERLLPSTPGFQPAAIPNGPSLVVTGDSLWVRGSGNAEAGASGLGKSGNLAVYDLATRRMILFPYDDAGYYRFWHGGAEGTPNMGFDLRPESDDPMATFGMRFVRE